MFLHKGNRLSMHSRSVGNAKTQRALYKPKGRVTIVTEFVIDRHFLHLEEEFI